MRVELEPGTYVVAVSGGVDSVVLLHALSQLPDVRLTVAHFDHGIRSDSNLDRRLVQDLAQSYGLPFVYHQGNLGSGASEALAREARYDFLRQVQSATKAQAIITAHHQDDLIETAVINMIRGTGRKGLTSLRNHRHLRRPLLHVPKADIHAYAKDQGLLWREDSTNQDLSLLRNYVRKVVVPKLGVQGRQDLLTHINHLSVVNRTIDNDLSVYMHLQPKRQVLDRRQFVMLPYDVSLEVMAHWLRSHDVTNFDSKLLERLVIKAKTALPGKQADATNGYRLLFGNESIALVNTQL